MPTTPVPARAAAYKPGSSRHSIEVDVTQLTYDARGLGIIGPDEVLTVSAGSAGNGLAWSVEVAHPVAGRQCTFPGLPHLGHNAADAARTLAGFAAGVHAARYYSSPAAGIEANR